MVFKIVYHQTSQIFESLELKYPNQIPYIYAIVSSLFVALSSLIVKFCKEIPAYEQVYFRSIILIFITNKLMGISGEKAQCQDKKAFKYLIWRSIFSAGSNICFFTSSQMINLAESNIIFLTSPIWSNILGYFFFEEKILLVNILYTIISFISIVFLLKPPFLTSEIQQNQPFDLKYLLGQIIGFGGAISYAINCHLNKHLKGSVSIQQLVFYLCSSVLICCSIIKVVQAYSTSQAFELKYIGFYIILALLQLVIQIFINQALFMKGANKIVPFNYFQVLFSFGFDYFLFEKPLDIIQTISTLVIIFCCYKIAVKT
ncbi:hypothetical protein ABPG74_022233 [Tetrahymena malaccensis]